MACTGCEIGFYECVQMNEDSALNFLIRHKIFTDTTNCSVCASVLHISSSNIKASNNSLFDLRVKWLFIALFEEVFQMNGTGLDTTLQLRLMELEILPDSDVSIAVYASGNGFSVFSMFRSGINESFSIVGRNKRREQISDLKGITLKGSTVIMYPEVFKGLDKTDMPLIDTWSKIHYPITNNLADQLNFSLEIIIVNDYGWEKNGSFDGVMEQLQRREVVMAATGFFMREERFRVVEFTAETYTIKTAIIFRQPALSSVRNIFLLPFSSAVWFCCISMCAAVIVVFCIEVIWTRKSGIEVETLNNVTFVDIVTLVLGTICQQGSHSVPQTASGRITLLLLSVTSLFLFTSYSANIVALLQSPSSALNSLSDLVDSPLTVGIQDMKYNRIYFKESTDPDTRRLYLRKVAPAVSTAYCSPHEGILRVRSGFFAFQVETHLGYQIISDTFTEHQKCGLSEIKLFPLPVMSLPLIKKSGYREIFTQKLRWQKEVGIFDRIARKWILQKPRCEARKGSGFVSVGLMEFLPALLVLLYGISASVIIFLLEILCFHKNKTLHCHTRRKLRATEERVFNGQRLNVMLLPGNSVCKSGFDQD